MRFKANHELDYIELIKSIGQVVPVVEYNNTNIALRHDVDHSLIHAMKIAELEHQNNIRSTYYLLPPEAYFSNYYGKWNHIHPYLGDQTKFFAKKLISMGHEVGLHSNLVTICMQSQKEPNIILEAILNDFKKIGIEIKTVAAHGDTQARKHGYINYEVFEEAGKKQFPFKQIKLSDYGLKEAYFYKRINYLSDSGGMFALCNDIGTEWNKNAVGCERDVQDKFKILEFASKMEKPSQVLIHPIWWIE
jgi:hypothetical protein